MLKIKSRSPSHFSAVYDVKHIAVCIKESAFNHFCSYDNELTSTNIMGSVGTIIICLKNRNFELTEPELSRLHRILNPRACQFGHKLVKSVCGSYGTVSVTTPTNTTEVFFQ